MTKTNLALIPLLIVSLAGMTTANDDLFGRSNSEGLLGGNADFISSSVDNSTNLADELLVNEEGVTWSGSYEWQTATQWVDHDQISDEPDVTSEFSGNLKLDARPDADYRALLNLDYKVGVDQAEVTVREGFADFSVNDQLFVRAGQQTLSWGVGYFFSPVDNLSSDSLDAQDPDADRVGTMAAKLHVPIETSNYYLYLLPDEQQNDFSIAGKAEWLVASNEVALGVIRHPSEEINVSVTTSIPMQWFDVFAEYNLSVGETSVAVDHLGTITDRSDQRLSQFTVGFTASEDLDNLGAINVSAQYFYNGQGYDHSLRIDSPMLWGQLAQQNELSSWAGQHYGAGRFSLTEIMGSDVSISFMALSDFSDESLLVSPSINWSPNEYVDVEAAMTVQSGEQGSSYAVQGDLTQYSLTVTLAKGRF